VPGGTKAVPVVDSHPLQGCVHQSLNVLSVLAGDFQQRIGQPQPRPLDLQG
jgi:hypothetical protein